MSTDLLTINDKPGEYPASWYAASAHPTPARNSLDGEIQTTVCIVGAGYTGLSTALHLARSGIDCVVLDANRVGWGASGRNGGQVGSGLNMEQPGLESRFGRSTAQALWQTTCDASTLVAGLCKEIAHQLSIECHYQPGVIYTSSTAKYFEEQKKYADFLATSYSFYDLEIVDRAKLASLLASDGYHGGVINHAAAHIHPLNYAKGLAALAESAGATIYENSRVTQLNIPFASSHSAMGGKRILTDQGSVIAQHLVIACNGYLNNLNTDIASRVMPINNYILATEPLPDTFPECLIAHNHAVCDDRFVVNYFRMSHDNRLLFGGGETWGYAFPSNVAEIVRKPMLSVFPQLAATRIDYAWGGTLAITRNRLPCFAETSKRVWSASGYSGHGVAMATMAGRIISAAIDGERSEFDLLSSLPSQAFPGGDRARPALLKLAMAWYATRDRWGF